MSIPQAAFRAPQSAPLEWPRPENDGPASACAHELRLALEPLLVALNNQPRDQKEVDEASNPMEVEELMKQILLVRDRVAGKTAHVEELELQGVNEQEAVLRAAMRVVDLEETFGDKRWEVVETSAESLRDLFAHYPDLA